LSQDQPLNRTTKELLSIQKNYLDDKILNILQLGKFGTELSHVKQRFIDTGIIIKNRRED
jgi:hypothetical protein